MTRLAPILLILLAFAGASCNGDDDAPSREEFADQANEICRETEAALEDVAEGADGPEDIVKAIDELIEESRDTIDELEDLERPEGEAGAMVEQFLNVLRTEIQGEGIPAFEELRGAVESEDRAAIRATVRRLRGIDSSASNRAARAVGATECAQD